ncbi:MAG: sugar phosphate isomerase/epimerase family protein [Planctomycetota bacterium]|jgi:sugar phosphate isomerase/epimerase
MKLGMHVDNWRHFDVSYEVPCQFAREYGLEYVEFGTIDADYFVQALGYNPHIPLHSDPLRLRSYLDSMGLKVSQLDAAYPMSSPEGQFRGIGYTLRSIQFAKALGCPCVDTTDGGRKPQGYTDEEVMTLIKQYYRVVLEWAQRYDIIVNIELKPFSYQKLDKKSPSGQKGGRFLRFCTGPKKSVISGKRELT